MATASPFTFGQRVGVLFITETAGASAAAVCALWLWIAFSTVVLRRQAHRRWKIDTPLHLYFLNLLFWDFIQAFGGLMSVRWIIDANVTEDSYCVAQGALKQLGDVGTAIASLTIAAHTFSTLVFRWTPTNSMLTASLIILGWWLLLVVILVVDIAVNGSRTFYGNTGYWCWITARFPVQRMVLDYVWMFIACLFNIVAYVPLYFVLKGTLVLDGWRLHRPHSQPADRAILNRSNRLALKMLMYPLTYTISVLPIAVARWTQFNHSDIPFAATVVCDMIYMSSGLINVILYALTRPFLLPHRENRGRMVENSINISFASQHDTPMRTPRIGRTPGISPGSFDLRSPHSASAFIRDQDGGLEPREPFRLVMPLPVPPPQDTFSSPTSDGNDLDHKDTSWHDRASSRADKAGSWGGHSGAGEAL
ncbi:hypothetical protein PENSPDRAFT_748391 [Peniophora sp. CONT]|nr:hypothetical protein PENSPDRAFT_748391 [Peniophora sp. CONT]